MNNPDETSWQLTIDCADPQLMVEFWAQALGYVPEPPPAGHNSWRAYWQDMGVPDEELPPGVGDLPDSIIDPDGRGPRVWFQQVPEAKTIKNRWHLDLKVGGGRGIPIDTRAARVRSTANRLAELGARITGFHDDPSMDHFAITMRDPEGNEFDVV